MREENFEGWLSVPGGKIWYAVRGADKSGTPLLTLHGGPGAPHNYLEPLGALADQRPVVFYDQLGCGKSDRPTDSSLWNIERFVQELQSLREHLKLEKFHIMGQSWGSVLACEYYFSHPEGVKSLILSGPALSMDFFQRDARSLLEYLPKKLRDAVETCEKSGNYNCKEYEEAVSKFYKLFVCRLDPWPECLNETLKGTGREVYEYMWGPSEFTATGILRSYDCTSRLGEIEIPVLLTCGQYDEVTPQTTIFYQSKIPGAEVVIFEGASHEHHLEKPQEYTAVLRRFFRRVQASEERKKHKLTNQAFGNSLQKATQAKNYQLKPKAGSL